MPSAQLKVKEQPSYSSLVNKEIFDAPKSESPELTIFKRKKSESSFDYESCSERFTSSKSSHNKFSLKKSLMLDFGKIENLMDTHMDEEVEVDRNRDILREIKNVNCDETRNYFPSFV